MKKNIAENMHCSTDLSTRFNCRFSDISVARGGEDLKLKISIIYRNQPTHAIKIWLSWSHCLYRKKMSRSSRFITEIS